MVEMHLSQTRSHLELSDILRDLNTNLHRFLEFVVEVSVVENPGTTAAIFFDLRFRFWAAGCGIESSVASRQHLGSCRFAGNFPPGSISCFSHPRLGDRQSRICHKCVSMLTMNPEN